MVHLLPLLIADPQADPALADYLRHFGFAARQVADADGLRQALPTQDWALLVLDRQLPGAEGLGEVAPLSARLPLILLGSGARAIDRILGLESGADDFLDKPFDPRELAARLHSVLRRCGARRPHAARTPATADLCFDGWWLDRESRRLRDGAGTQLPLSDAEYRLLGVLMQAPHRVFSREQLAALARGQALALHGRSIDLLVSRLRQKLADAPLAPRWLRTVRGAGYVLALQAPHAAGRPWGASVSADLPVAG
jgi:two-component system OmpR family response regulator